MDRTLNWTHFAKISSEDSNYTHGVDDILFSLSIYLAAQRTNPPNQRDLPAPGAQRDHQKGGLNSANTAERKIQPDNGDYHNNWLAPPWEA